MKKTITLVLFYFLAYMLNAQVIYEDFESEILEESRGLKIQLPRNYDPEEKRDYPLVLVFDGDYLFEPVAGNIDYQAYWEDIPDCIIVGIKQSKTREDDFLYDDETFFPDEGGADFFEFVTKELMPHINDNYNTSDFRIVIGHDKSANFLNYFLFKTPPLFRAYIALSPDLAPEMTNRLLQRLPALEKETFYYMATGDSDVKALRTAINDCDKKLKLISNTKLHYRFDNFKDANHYSLVGRGIPRALNSIFEVYKPINGKEYNEKVLTYESSPYDYLMKKYDDIEYFYGFKKKLIENDIRAIAAASTKKDDLESFEKLARLAKKEFPESMISAYYSGLYNEKAGNLKRALQRYESGLLLEPSQFIDKEMMLERMYQVKEELKN